MRVTSVKNTSSRPNSRKGNYRYLFAYSLLAGGVFLGSFYLGLNFVGPRLEQSPSSVERRSFPSPPKAKGSVEIVELPSLKKPRLLSREETKAPPRPPNTSRTPPQREASSWAGENLPTAEEPSVMSPEEAGSAKEVPPPSVGMPPEPPKTLWKVQVGAFSSAQNALDLVNRLNQEGHPSTLRITETGRGTVYKVQIERTFSDKAQAESQAQELEAKGIPAIVVEEQQ
jgi:cell division protein FtsN